MSTRETQHLIRCAIALVAQEGLSEVAGESRAEIAHKLELMLAADTPPLISTTSIPEVVAYPSTLIPESEWKRRAIDGWLKQWLDDCDSHERRVYEATIAFIQSVRATAPTPPAQDDEPVAYGARNFMTKEFAPVLSENKDTIQDWIGDRHRSQDSITYEGPIPLYTRPDNDKLRKAAEEVSSGLALWAGMNNTVPEWLREKLYVYAENLRAALEKSA